MQLGWLWEGLRPLVPMGIAAVGAVVVILAVRYGLESRFGGRPDQRLKIQLVLLVLSFAGLIVVIELAPLAGERQGQLLSLIGILLSAALALSSTTFLGNALAGMMLRAIRSFRLGDFVQVGEHFGRVSERGLFHTEIQSEYRDLISLPNLYLVTNPVRVVRTSGTIITAEVTLGYDVPRTQVEKALLEAAQAAGLQEAFVHVLTLGNFSITYRVAGLLTDVKSLLSARSRLREAMLDHLHGAGIEVVSPTFMNTRPIRDGQRFVPPAQMKEEQPEEEVSAEKIAFDKAEKAEYEEGLQRVVELLEETTRSRKEEIEATKDEAAREGLLLRLQQLESARAQLGEFVKQRRPEGEGQKNK